MRVVIEAVTPAVADGPFQVKRVVGEEIAVEADLFADGHDLLGAVVLHRRVGEERWREAPMKALVNDRWRGRFEAGAVGAHEFTIEAWIDPFATWRRDLNKRAAAGQELATEFVIGAMLVEEAVAGAGDAGGAAAAEVRAAARRLRDPAGEERLAVALDESLLDWMGRHAPRRFAARMERPVPVWVDRERARFSAWYELFPRSCGSDGRRHGTLRDVIARLDDVAAMGFDVLYLPPIHPIGRRFRKGRNNALAAGPDDVGSPWAIGAAEGGHDALHPQLGSFEDFAALIEAARARGMEVALDLALQCSVDHPWLRDHPGWFRHLPDGSIRCAENPPKVYQDIVPIDFECDDWRALWDEILRVVLGWVARGVRVFRVDNPHTKPFALWEWLIAEVKRREPDVLFLAEAFTRPKVMLRLAKLGFTQSYTYFAWRNGAAELEEYFTGLTATAAIDCYRPNAWPNTPDILTEQLQTGGRAAFIVRAALAATLCASWGVYGPAFELMEHVALRPGSEEYLDSEKYQLRAWPLDRPDSLAPLLAALNAARRGNPALRQDRTLRFHRCENPAIVCYSKVAGDNAIVVAANVDPHRMHWSAIDLDLDALGLDDARPYEMDDLLTGVRYRWHGRRNVVGLDPAACPVHVFRVRRHVRTEGLLDLFE